MDGHILLYTGIIIQTWASALLFCNSGQCESLGWREEQQYRLSRLSFFTLNYSFSDKGVVRFLKIDPYMNIPNPGSVLWLTGLDNFSFRDIDSEGFIDTAADAVKFTAATSDPDEDFIFLLEFYEYVLENLEEATVLKPRSVVDGLVKGLKLRFIIGQLSVEDTVEYIFNAPEDYSVIILSRPIGITKARIEQLASEQERVWINVPMPKASNISEAVTKKKRWTKECFFRNVTKIACQILLGIIINLLTPIAGGLFNNLNK